MLKKTYVKSVQVVEICVSYYAQNRCMETLICSNGQLGIAEASTPIQ